MVLLSQYPTEYQQNFKKLMNRSTRRTVYRDKEYSTITNIEYIQGELSDKEF